MATKDQIESGSLRGPVRGRLQALIPIHWGRYLYRFRDLMLPDHQLLEQVRWDRADDEQVYPCTSVAVMTLRPHSIDLYQDNEMDHVDRVQLTILDVDQFSDNPNCPSVKHWKDAVIVKKNSYGPVL
jgi:hypothetical protein